MKKAFILKFLVISTSICYIDTPAHSQDTTQSFFIKEICISGNQVTKKWIITRELKWKKADRIPKASIDSLLTLEENKLYNTNLFVTVDINAIALKNDTIDIDIQLKENWYILPLPIFQVADRNLSNWLFSNNRDPGRLEYGLIFDWSNFRGRKEKLSLLAQLGFTRKLSLRYSIPFIDKKKTIGLSFRASLSENKKISAIVLNNRDTFNISSDDESLRISSEISISGSKRIGFYQFHDAEIKYRTVRVADTIINTNPEYLIGGRSRQKTVQLRYAYTYDFRDRSVYPLKGFLFNTGIQAIGLFNTDDVNYTELWVAYARFLSLGKELYFVTQARANLVLGRQSFEVRRGLGFGANTIRGYELYVINGTHYGVLKNEFRWRFLNQRLNVNSIIPIKQFNTIPVWSLVKTYFDMGYAYQNNALSENQLLNNKIIFGWGVGIDIVSYYNFVLNLEYSFNSLGQSGFFININSGI